MVIEIAARYTDRVSQGLNRTRSSADRLSSSLTRTQQRADRLGRTRTNIELSLRDRALQGIERTYNRMKSLAGRAWSVTVRLADKATKPLQGIVKTLKSPVLQVGAAIGVTVGAKDALDTYVGFEKSMSNVQAISGASAENMERLTAKAREMGRTTTKSASEAADAMGYMALAGWDSDKILQGIQPVLRLSEAGDMDLGRTSDLVTDSMSALGLDTSELQGYLDKVAKTSASSNTNIDSMMSAFLEFGGTVRQNDMLLEDASALIGILANRGVKGAEAGNALNSVLTNLTTGMGQAGKAMEELGISAFEENGKFRGYAETLQAVYDATKDMNDEQKNYYLSAIGGKVRLSDLQKMMSGVVEEYGDLRDEIADSNGALEEMAHIMSDNIYGDMKAFQSAFDDLKITIVDQFQPHIRRFIQWMTRGMLAINEPVEKMAKNISEKMENTKKRIDRLTKSFAWKNTDLSGKIKLAWDKVIAEPFEQWWSSKGQAWFEEKARNIGYGIGSGLSGGLLALLGIPVEDAANSGLSIGKSFAQGFIDGFDADAVWNALKAKLAEGIQSAGKIMPGGEEATGGSWLWAGLLGAGALKLGRGALKMNRIGRSTAGVERGLPSSALTILGGNAGTGVGVAASRTGSITRASRSISAADDYTDFWRNANRFHITTREAAISQHQSAWRANAREVGSRAKITAGVERAESSILRTMRAIAPATAKVEPAIKGLGKIFKNGGWLSVLLSGVSIAAADNKKQETVRQAGGLSGSMLGGTAGAKIGAAIGTVIAPGIGLAIGSAIGGLAGSILGYAGGTKLGQKVYDLFKSEEEKEAAETITKEREKQLRLEKNMDKLSQTQDDLKALKEQCSYTKELSDQWSAIQYELKDESLTAEERLMREQELKGIVEQLAGMYPDIIHSNDLDNQKLSEKLGMIEKMHSIQMNGRMGELQSITLNGDDNLATLTENQKDSQKAIGSLEKQKENIAQVEERILELFEANAHLQRKINAAEANGNERQLTRFKNQKTKNENEIGDQVKSVGIEFSDYGFTRDFNETRSLILEKYSEINQELANAQGSLIETSNQIDNLYNAHVELIELQTWEKLGMSVQDAASQYESMDAASQRTFDKIVSSIDSVNAKFGELTQTKYIDIVMNFKENNKPPEYGPKLSTSFDFKKKETYIGAKARGDIVSKAEVALIGEAGPEAIIPLSGTNKHRGIKLWQETGEMLGTLPKHARGGIFGGVVKPFNQTTKESSNSESGVIPPVTVNLGGMNFSFQGADGESREGVMTAIRAEMPQITNELADELAKVLAKVFSNMKMQPEGI